MKFRFEPNEFESGQDIKLVMVNEDFPLPADGSLLKIFGNPKVYWMEKGKRRWIETGQIFKKMEEGLGFTQNDIQSILDWQMVTIEEGDSIREWPENDPSPELQVDKIIMGYLPEQVYNMRLPQAKELGFTAFHSHEWGYGFWSDHFEIAKKNGLKCVVQLYTGKLDEGRIREVVETFKNDPELLMWVTYDDFDFLKIEPDNQRTLYDWVKKYDDKHPVAVTGTDVEWGAYLCKEAFDVMFNQFYAHREGISNASDWLLYMYDRLDGWGLEGKRIIPVIQTFGPRGVYTQAAPKPDYDIMSNKLKIKSSACWDWHGIAKNSLYQDDVGLINADKGVV